MTFHDIKLWTVQHVPGMRGVQAFLYRFKPYTSKFRHYYVNRAWSPNLESASGEGSSLTATEALRRALPALYQEYGIRSILDIPCGDFCWMKEVPRDGIHYIGADIVFELIAENQRRYSASNVEFRRLDMLKGPLPKVDLIFCRDCFIHYPYRYIVSAIEQYIASGAKYVLLSTYPGVLENSDLATPGLARKLNLLNEPFCFPPPLASIDEQFEGKVMALWDVQELAKSPARRVRS